MRRGGGVEAFVDPHEAAGQRPFALVRRLTATLEQNPQSPFVHGHQHEIDGNRKRRKIGGIIGVGHAKYLIY